MPETVKPKIDWEPIAAAAKQGFTYQELAEKFGVKVDTIRQKAHRGGWVLPKNIKAAVQRETKRAIAETAKKAATAAVADWSGRGDQLREDAFRVAHASIKKFKPRAPKSFRELESATKIARQAAGLDTEVVGGAVLIQMHERMENFADEQPIEATVVDAEFAKELPDSLPAPSEEGESSGVD